MKCTVLIERYLHLLQCQVAVLRCFGQIPFRCEQHFHRLSGFWSHTRNSLEFLCKGSKNKASVCKNNFSFEFHQLDLSKRFKTSPIGFATDRVFITKILCHVLLEMLECDQIFLIDLHGSFVDYLYIIPGWC